MRLRGTGTFRPVSPVVFIAVSQGISYTEMLAKSVRRALGAPEPDFPFHPHVTIAHNLDDASLDQAYDELSTFECEFSVTGSRSTTTTTPRAGSPAHLRPRSRARPSRRTRPRSSDTIVFRCLSSSDLKARAASGNASVLRCARAMTRSSDGLSSWVARRCGPGRQHHARHDGVAESGLHESQDGAHLAALDRELRLESRVGAGARGHLAQVVALAEHHERQVLEVRDLHAVGQVGVGGAGQDQAFTQDRRGLDVGVGVVQRDDQQGDIEPALASSRVSTREPASCTSSSMSGYDAWNRLERLGQQALAQRRRGPHAYAPAAQRRDLVHRALGALGVDQDALGVGQGAPRRRSSARSRRGCGRTAACRASSRAPGSAWTGSAGTTPVSSAARVKCRVRATATK